MAQAPNTFGFQTKNVTDTDNIVFNSVSLVSK